MLAADFLDCPYLQTAIVFLDSNSHNKVYISLFISELMDISLHSNIHSFSLENK